MIGRRRRCCCVVVFISACKDQPNSNGVGPIDVPPVAEKPMSVERERQRQRQRQRRQLEQNSTGVTKNKEDLPQHSSNQLRRMWREMLTNAGTVVKT
ncbi:hypothetical protein L218DRAFT_735729 [Marasmius fiardii PR-910]|nr:hypothetical protein L218DRAFT_735729 [Marasmius fiardii PR-910]